MSSKAAFRLATTSDSRKIAELFRIASGGVAEYVWSTLAPEYPGLTPLEIGARRYARDEGAFSYINCTVAELGGGVIGMLHAFYSALPSRTIRTGQLARRKSSIG